MNTKYIEYDVCNALASLLEADRHEGIACGGGGGGGGGGGIQPKLGDLLVAISNEYHYLPNKACYYS